jgi:hypothetical protein
MPFLLNNISNFKYFGILFIFYFIAHGGILLISNAVYWDDWILYQVDSEIILDIFRQAGIVFNLNGRMHNLLLAVGPGLYRVITFLMMFGVGVSLDGVLKNYKLISVETRFVIILIFLTLPFYWARVALIDLPYTVAYFLFFLAWAIMGKYRIISLLFFFLSFNTNSLLAFYAVPFLEYYYRTNTIDISVKSFINFCFCRADFFLLPFIFFTIKICFYPPYGLYAGYNQQYDFSNLVISPFLMLTDWAQIKISIFLFVVVILISYGILGKLLVFSNVANNKGSILFFLLSLLVFILGGFPYWILGHVPTFVEWGSRFQLLLPLGFTFLLISLIAFFRPKARLLVIAGVLSASTLLNIEVYKDFYFDWLKQKALIMLFADNKKIQDASLIIIDDRTTSINAIHRVYRNYEWNGLLASAFGDESRFGLQIGELSSFIEGKMFYGYFVEGEKYRAASFDPSGSIKAVLVTIKPGGGWLKSMFDKDLIVKIEVSSYPDITIKKIN